VAVTLSMMLGRLERLGSGSECSCSPYSTPSGHPHVRVRQTGSKARRAASALPMGKSVGYAAAVEMVEEVLEPEAELLSRDLLEEKFGQDGSHIDNIQHLERMKGELSTVLQDLETDSSMELSVGVQLQPCFSSAMCGNLQCWLAKSSCDYDVCALGQYWCPRGHKCAAMQSPEISKKHFSSKSIPRLVKS